MVDRSVTKRLVPSGTSALLVLILCSSCATNSAEADEGLCAFCTSRSPEFATTCNMAATASWCSTSMTGAIFLRRIPLGGLNDQGQPLNVKGICASAVTQRIYVSTLHLP